MSYTLFLRYGYLLMASLIVLGSCASIPDGAIPVKPFDKIKYLGKWYEIARLDIKYERNLNNTTAVYSINEDGRIKVENRGFDVLKKVWKQAIGKAKLVGDDQEARLKVSFFGPFYAGYNIIGLDPDYKYALVAGGSLKYLWILSRETTIPDEVKQDYLHIANALGYKTADLIWVAHENN